MTPKLQTHADCFLVARAQISEDNLSNGVRCVVGGFCPRLAFIPGKVDRTDAVEYGVLLCLRYRNLTIFPPLFFFESSSVVGRPKPRGVGSYLSNHSVHSLQLRFQITP